MPPNSLPHITRWLSEIGFSEAAGMGMGPTSWREIDAWCSRTAINLGPWEARLIRQLSIEYVAESSRAENEHCPPPWRGPVLRQEIEIEEEALDSVLG